MSGELDKLNDIIVPEPVSFWPLAPGWSVLGLVILALLIPWFIRAWRRYQGDSYRREASREAETISCLDDPQVKLTRLLDLLKRTALTAYPREQVAGLSGEAWWKFLYTKSLATKMAAGHSRDVDFSPAFIRQLNDVLYNPAAAFSEEKLIQLSDQLMHKVRVWIKQHQQIEDSYV